MLENLFLSLLASLVAQSMDESVAMGTDYSRQVYNVKDMPLISDSLYILLQIPCQLLHAISVHVHGN